MPFQLLRHEVEARITATTVEIFHRCKLVASHLRSHRPHRPSTVADHMPSSHRHYRDWTHERIAREAASIGDDTAALVEIILRSRPHPEQGFRSCIGILGLGKRFGAERLDAASARALALGTRSYSSVAAILKHRQDSKPATTEPPNLLHENIRGPGDARHVSRSGKYMMAAFGIELTDKRRATLRFEQFPQFAHDRLLVAPRKIEQRLEVAVRATEPNRTGKLQPQTGGRVYDHSSRIAAVVGVRAPDANDARKAAPFRAGTAPPAPPCSRLPGAGSARPGRSRCCRGGT